MRMRNLQIHMLPKVTYAEHFYCAGRGRDGSCQGPAPHRQTHRSTHLRQGGGTHGLKLQNMGIRSLIVAGHPIWQDGDRTLEEQLADLELRFAKTGDEPLTGMLKKIYRDYLVKSMGETDDQ